MSLSTIPQELWERVFEYLAEDVIAVLSVRGPESEPKKANRQLPHF